MSALVLISQIIIITFNLLIYFIQYNLKNKKYYYFYLLYNCIKISYRENKISHLKRLMMIYIYILVIKNPNATPGFSRS